MEAPGFNGTPPVVYGVVWNPLKPQVRGWVAICLGSDPGASAGALACLLAP